MNPLSSEFVLSIVYHLASRDLRNLCLFSKSFRSWIQPVLFVEFRTNLDETETKTVERLETFSESLRV